MQGQLLHLFYSNRIEALYLQIKENLFASSSPFLRRILIIPSSAIKSWIMFQMAKDPFLGIATGMEVYYLDQAIDQLSQLLPIPSTMHKTIPSSLDLTYAIEVEIRKIIESWETKNESEKQCWMPLLRYLKLFDGEMLHLSSKGERRLIGLSETLASLFLKYGVDGGTMVQEWESKQSSTKWQEQLWINIFSSPSSSYTWIYPYKKISNLFLEQPSEFLKGIEVHLFSISFLSHVHHQFFTKISHLLPVNYYLLSPCQLFWSDILSDSEFRRLKNFWKKRDISEIQLNTLEEYLRDRNPLLANFGRLGREMAQQLEESSSHSSEVYFLPSATLNHNVYSDLLTEDFIFEKSNDPLSLLQMIQTDMLLLRHPEVDQKISISEKDDSIQIHIAPTRMREVEIIYDVLMGIIDKHQQKEYPIFPHDIIVMAPNISEYASFIKAIFGSNESQLDYQVMDLETSAQNSYVQGFLHLLLLPFSRWDAISILQLFEFEHFRKCHHLSIEDISKIRHWVQKSGVRWGHDVMHRNELLKQDYCKKGMVEETSIGTWEDGISQLLLSLTMVKEESEKNVKASSLDPEKSQNELLSKWMILIRSLRDDLMPLNDGTELTVTDWAEYLNCLAETYFGIKNHTEEFLNDDQKMLFDQINQICRASRFFGERKLNFNSIRHHLESGFKKGRISYRETHLHAIRFCSMLPMRAVPAKVIVLMGMDEKAFPKIDPHFSLNLMLGNPKVDYFPSLTDYDRFLFLEALLSARQYFLMSYLGCSASDSKEQPPSLLVTEVMDYLDKACHMGSTKPSKHCTTKHPFLSYDKRYFQKDGQFQSYSKSRYRAALAYYQIDKKPFHHFLCTNNSMKSDLSCVKKLTFSTDSKNELCISLKQLASFARNPLKAYFNKTLGIYLRDEEEEKLTTEEPFVISPLDLAIYKKASLTQPIKKILSLAERKGSLPCGVFKSIAIKKIEKEVKALQDFLSGVGISAEEIIEIEFGDQYRFPDLSQKNKWCLPSLKMEIRDHVKVKIIGKFSEVTPQGLIVHAKDDRVDVIKYWPQFLVYTALAKEYSLPIKNNLLFTKTEKSKAAFFQNPHELLKEYLDYYLKSHETMSPLIPEWVFDFIKLNEEEFNKRIQESLNQDFKSLYNVYLDWICRTPQSLDTASLLRDWKNVAQKLFGDLLDQ